MIAPRCSLLSALFFSSTPSVSDGEEEVEIVGPYPNGGLIDEDPPMDDEALRHALPEPTCVVTPDKL